MALRGRSPLRMESVSISTRASYSPYSAWKCAGLWSLKYIRTTIPKNRVTSGISSFHFTLSAPAASEAASARATPSAIGTLRTHSLAGQTAVIGVLRERTAGSTDRIGVFAANCRGAYHVYFQDSIDHRPAADVSQRGSEESTLPHWNNVRNDDDQSGVEAFPTIKRREIGPIICHKRILLVTDSGHQLPILVAT